MSRFVKHLIAFLVFLFLVNIVFTYFYEKPIRRAIKNKKHDNALKYEDLHNPENKYNLFFLGSSRGYCAYSPLIIDSIVNTVSYNMCTASQNVIESYFTLKEILLHQKPKYIVFDMCLVSFNDVNDYSTISSNAKFYSSSRLKWNMVIKGFGVEGVINYFFSLLKHKIYIKRDIYHSLKQNRQIHDRENQIREWKSGYLYRNTVADSVQISRFNKLNSFENTNVSEKKVRYFTKLAELCKKNNIELICVRAPYPPFRLNISPLDDTVSEYFRNLCNQQNVPFYDFNKIRNPKYQYLDTDFIDHHHFNFRGATKVSKQLSELINQDFLLH